MYKLNGTTKEYVSFYLSADAASTTNEVTVTAANGEVTIFGLPTNRNTPNETTTYYLEEVKAPDGYVLNPNPVEFTIDRAGAVQWKDGNTWTTGNPTMLDKPIKVTLQKLAEDTGTELTGAVFTLTPESGKKFADGTTDAKTLTMTGGTLLIDDNPTPILIGGDSYTLTETKAPDGYEATAVINFTVKEDGSIHNTKTDLTAETVTINSTTGGYRVSGSCAEADNTKQDGTTEEYQSTLKIRDEKIRVTLTKLGVDGSGATETLAGVNYKLTPYNISNGDHFSDNATEYTYTTDANGVITIPDGLLVHGCKYLLQEQASQILTDKRYYLGKEASSGVILHVSDDGTKITVERTSTAYTGECPVTAADPDANGKVALTAKNPKAAVFQFTKSVSGNMGDVTGSFEITMTVYEPDGTLITTKQVTLEKGQKYSSESGKLAADGTTVLDNGDSVFGPNAIPVNAILVIKENSAEDYKAYITNYDGATVLSGNETGEVRLKLTKDVGADGTVKNTFTLTNNKDVPIDVGVVLEENTPYALIALLIPAVWLYLRSRRRRRDGDDE